MELQVVLEDLFLEEEQLHKQYVQIQTSSISLDKEIGTINRIFDSMSEKTIDKNLQSTIKAEKQKQLKSLQKLEKKLLKQALSMDKVKAKQASLAAAQIKSLKEKMEDYEGKHLRDYAGSRRWESGTKEEYSAMKERLKKLEKRNSDLVDSF